MLDELRSDLTELEAQSRRAGADVGEARSRLAALEAAQQQLYGAVAYLRQAIAREEQAADASAPAAAPAEAVPEASAKAKDKKADPPASSEARNYKP